MTPRERVYATIRGEPADRTPVMPIFMAWAAHYIGCTYRDYYMNARVLADAQVAVATAFELDQVSAISDPWREAEALGMILDYPDEGVGIPRGPRLASRQDHCSLRVPDVASSPRMADRVEGVRLMARRLGQTHSVMGWVEGPLAEYVDLRGLEPAMLDLVDEPRAFQAAAETLVQTGERFAAAQVNAGADMIGIGDAAASLVGPQLFRDLILPLQTRLIQSIHAMGAAVRLHVCGNIGPIIADMARTGADIIDVDWMVPLDEARCAAGPEVTLCGNFNPAGVLLRGTPQSVAAAAEQCIRDGGRHFILQPGCEVPPGTPEANIRAFCPGRGSLVALTLVHR